MESAGSSKMLINLLCYMTTASQKTIIIIATTKTNPNCFTKFTAQGDYFEGDSGN
jgi:hypothetical protein